MTIDSEYIRALVSARIPEFELEDIVDALAIPDQIGGALGEQIFDVLEAMEDKLEELEAKIEAR